MSTPIRIAIVDPYEPVRKGLKLLFEDSPGLRFVGETHSAADMLLMCERTKPDVVIFDFASQVNNIEVIEQLLKQCPQIKVLVLTANMEADCVQAALRAGASGYLYKGVELDELDEAIRAVYRGQQAFDEEVKSYFSNEHNKPMFVLRKLNPQLNGTG